MTSRRPWWKRKRWAAALAVWLVTAYPLGNGPASYAVVRGWVEYDAARVVFLPLEAATPVLPPFADAALQDYGYGWVSLARQHEEAAASE